MAASRKMIAIDLGASSGRTILGELGRKLSLREIHRFPNGPVSDSGRMRWDFDRLWQSVQEGIRRPRQMPAETLRALAWTHGA